MKYLLLLILLFTSLNAKWRFNDSHIDNLTSSQKHIINTSLKIGNTKGLGIALASLSVVETRAGNYMGNTKNRICGVHQVDVINLKKKLQSNGNWKKLCNEINQNVYYSATVALNELSYWVNNSKSLREAVNRYNRGWVPHKHDLVFWNRFWSTYIVIANAVAEGKLGS